MQINEFDTLRGRWHTLLTGNGNADPSDPDVASRIRELSAAAEGHWRSMAVSSDTANAPWRELDIGAASRHLTESFRRVSDMALAYRTQGSPLLGHEKLRADILYALEALHGGYYNESLPIRDNWWDWQIGTPLQIVDCITLMHDEMNEEQLASSLRAVEHFESKLVFSGANLVWVCTIAIVTGILAKDGRKVAEARDRLAPAFRRVERGDGFYKDGSFVQHQFYAYTGGYGLSLLLHISRLLYLLEGTSFDFAPGHKEEIRSWVFDSYGPLLYKGAMMDMVRGREIAREQMQDQQAGRLMLEAVVTLSANGTCPQTLEIKRAAKYWLAEDDRPNRYAGGSVFFIAAAKALMKDATIAPMAEPIGCVLYNGMDRVVHLRPGFGLGISMSSARIANYESIIGENFRGWYTGDGMTFLYNGDHGQFSGDYWPTVQAYRLPGTTVDTQVRADESGFGYQSGEHWAGGVGIGIGSSVDAADHTGGCGSKDAADRIGACASVDAADGGKSNRDGHPGASRHAFAAVGMSLQAWNSPLRARKSWFLLGDEIAAIGSGIACPEQHIGVGWDGERRRTETIVENRKLGAEGTNRFIVDDVEKPSGMNWTELMPGVSWAHLEGNEPGSGIGYYFPGGAMVHGLREERRDRWRSINIRNDSDREASNSFLSLWFDHGTSPEHADYAYVLLPGLTASETGKYAADPGIVVAANTEDVHAVRHAGLGVIGANFWTDSLRQVDIDGQLYMSSSRKAAVMTREIGGRLEISVADPTQVNTATIEIEINRAAVASEYADNGVEVLQLAPTIKLAIHTAGAQGASFQSVFALQGE